MKQFQQAEPLVDIIGRLPERCFLKFCKEFDENDESTLVMCVMEEPPEGGWETRGQWRGIPRDQWKGLDFHPSHLANDEVARVGVSSNIGDSRFLKLCVDAAERFISAQRSLFSQ